MVGLKASGLQIIQVAYVSDGRKFVDNAGSDIGKPYYYSSNQLSRKDHFFTSWNGTSGVIKAQDLPDAQKYFQSLRFETLIIGVNFENSGIDKLLGAFQWGFTDYGHKLITHDINLQKNATSETLNVIRNSYPNYKIK